jgi:hypothetical protein
MIGALVKQIWLSGWHTRKRAAAYFITMQEMPFLFTFFPT